ncbi:hypothetical protein RB195_016031 [Necator americanus]|uniref:BPTI/Kunitz inhibitor domain-containing protein n=1 Tax=Necator americanus TaxID=51031 RepID=A0ABR1E9W2_NECAM
MRTIFVLLLLCVLFCYCEVNNSKKSQPWERCLAPTHKDGPQCKAYIIRYTYNRHSRRCEPFVYGGCNPSRNNFKRLERCQQICEGIKYPKA